MIDLVIDTNIVISAIGWSGAPKLIIDAWASGKIIVMVSEDIIREYQITIALIAKKYPEIEFEDVLNDLLLKIHLCEPVKFSEAISRDPDDDKFIACVLSTKSKIIVSGDADLLDIPINNNFFVMKAKDFYDAYLQ